ncbi:MAG TPA: hypothetical protein VMM17_10875 [Gemmatimonadaceae bacterium]|nr:hypothetical protein [Gemmatimonadaceae bacterium]
MKVLLLFPALILLTATKQDADRLNQPDCHALVDVLELGFPVAAEWRVLTFQSVGAGRLHSCGVTTAGAAYCWGNNPGGQLGDGTSQRASNVPVAVSGGLTFQSVDVGRDHVCGITTAGAAYCWGGGTRYSRVPQPRNPGRQPDRSEDPTMWRYSPSNVPVEVSGGLLFESVSAGYLYSCGLTAAGAAYCWGINSKGQLGAGERDPFGVRTAPVAVSGGLRFQSLSAGDDSHTCGVTTGGAAYCWGSNVAGELGTETIQPGTTIRSLIPVAVSGGLTFQSVSAGFRHTCGVTTAGAAYCWGNNNFGQLGDGTATRSNVPVAVSGGLTFQSVSAGTTHTCGVTTAGVAYCWGRNAYGERGDGTRQPNNVTVNLPVAVSGDFRFRSVSAGGDSHTCGVTTAGVAYCWGGGGVGQRGDGTWGTTPGWVPVAVAGGLDSNP